MDPRRQRSAQATGARTAVRVVLSRAARRALDARTTPLVVEMELFFSCLVRKRVRCGMPGPDDSFLRSDPCHDNLRVWFHPVVSQHCSLPADGDLDALPLQDFPLVRKAAFTPRWLRLDYRDGVFVGDFGW